MLSLRSLLACSLVFTATPGLALDDVFGIPMLMPSRQPELSWNSLHWAKGSPRTLTDWDGTDPSGWSRRRGDGNLMDIDGKGVLSMGGPQPRLYIMPAKAGSPPFFRDIEFTGYFRRTANDGADYAGFVVGTRSGPEGHGNLPCTANTYYLAFRNTGSWGFDKELNHPIDADRYGGPLFPAGFPLNRWVGMKFLVYNLPGDKTVKLEAYVDTVSGGDVGKGVTWKKLGETVDKGDWPADPGDCGYPATTVVTQGGGVVFIRNTETVKAEYKLISWREIDPNGTVAVASSPAGKKKVPRPGGATHGRLPFEMHRDGRVGVDGRNAQ